MKIRGEGFRPPEAMSHPVPDLLAEYGHEQVSFAGVTLTLAEAIVICPVDEKDMLPEDIGMIAAGMLNEAGIAIKEEHLGYFQEVIEMRDEDLKVTVRPEEDLHIPEETEELNQTKPERLAQHKEPVASTTPTENVVILAAQTTESDTSLAEASFAIQSQNRIDQKESPLDQTELDDNNSQPAIQDYQETEGSTAEESTPDTTPSPIKQVAPRIKPLKEQSIISLREDSSEDEITERQPLLQKAEPINAIRETAQQMPTVNPPVDEGLLVREPEAESELMDIADHLPSEDFKQPQAETLTLSELLPEEVFIAPEDLTLTEQIILFAETSETIDEEIQVEIKLLAVEIENEVQILAEMMVDPAFGTEEIELVEQKLELLCATLLEYAGIDYDQEVLERFVQTLIRQEAEKNPSKTEEVTYDKGTHEAKVFTLRDFMFSIQSRLADFRRLGRYAIVNQVNIWGA